MRCSDTTPSGYGPVGRGSVSRAGPDGTVAAPARLVKPSGRAIPAASAVPRTRRRDTPSRPVIAVVVVKDPPRMSWKHRTRGPAPPVRRVVSAPAAFGYFTRPVDENST